VSGATVECACIWLWLKFAKIACEYNWLRPQTGASELGAAQVGANATGIGYLTYIFLNFFSIFKHIEDVQKMLYYL
jgi:hypothetical protein